ncbi:hypothetical protein Csa_019973 [Cucumis sativus]|nr:hypothetical protein Csa_019973 [Cucumis sativus]
MLFHGRGLPTGECLHGRRSSRQKVAGVRGAAVSSQQEVASRGLQGSRLLVTTASSQFTECLHGCFFTAGGCWSSRRDCFFTAGGGCGKDRGEISVWRSWKRLHGREIDRGEIWRSRKRLHGKERKRLTAGLHGKERNLLHGRTSRQGPREDLASGVRGRRLRQED